MHIVIPLFDRFTALDAVGPYEVLSRVPDAEVVFAGEERGPYRTDTGSLALVADASFDEVTAADVLVVPGGPGTRRMMSDPSLIEWVRTVHPTTTWTTSVCTGSLILGAAGLLDGLDAATHWATTALLESTGARYAERRVVRQGKIITAAGVSAGIDMALTLAAELAGREVAEAIQLSIEYDPQPPFDCGSVSKAGPARVQLVAGVLADRAARETPDD